MILVSGVLMVVMGMMGKVAAIFTTIPEPVMGGMFIVMFGVISAAGVSNLQVHTRYLIMTFIRTKLLHNINSPLLFLLFPST